MIAGATGLSFTDFIVNLAPIGASFLRGRDGTPVPAYRKRLQIAPKARKHLMSLDARRSIEDPEEFIRTVPILAATIVAFFVHKSLDLEPATVALAGAAVMLLVTRQRSRRHSGGSSGRPCSSSSGCSSWWRARGHRRHPGGRRRDRA